MRREKVNFESVVQAAAWAEKQRKLKQHEKMKLILR